MSWGWHGASLGSGGRLCLGGWGWGSVCCPALALVVDDGALLVVGWWLLLRSGCGRALSRLFGDVLFLGGCESSPAESPRTWLRGFFPHTSSISVSASVLWDGRVCFTSLSEAVDGVDPLVGAGFSYVGIG